MTTTPKIHSGYKTQNDVLLKHLMKFYNEEDNLERIVFILKGEKDSDSVLSIRLIDWFVGNYSKQYFIVYTFKLPNGSIKRFKVYNDYKLKLKAYSKKRFDPFCRYERINLHYKDNIYIETTIGQLNFFKWAFENKIIEYIKEHREAIEADMNKRNSTAKKKLSLESTETSKSDMSMDSAGKTRKKREELSKSAVKSIKIEKLEVSLDFSNN
jgi:hypothetical protein